MDMNLSAVILGAVEGITEFLPISSTGHLILVNLMVKLKEPFAGFFEVVIQLGAIISVIVYFRDKLNPLKSSLSSEKKKEIFEIWKKTLVAVVPALIIGGLFGSKIEKHLFNPTVVTIALIIGGVLLIIIEKIRKTVSMDSVNQFSYGKSIAIGFIQCIAMIPGTSRAAATIIGAMFLGASRRSAAEFSFFLAIPTMTAASAYKLMKHGTSLNAGEWQALGIGFVISFLTAWAVIAFFMRYIQKNDFKLFGYYRIVLGIAIIIIYNFI